MAQAVETIIDWNAPVTVSLPCPRCGGHGGTMMSDGYLACYCCGDSGKYEASLSPLYEFDLFVGSVDGGMVSFPMDAEGNPITNDPTYYDQANLPSPELLEAANAALGQIWFINEYGQLFPIYKIDGWDVHRKHAFRGSEAAFKEWEKTLEV